MAQETVSECCHSLLYASRLISKNQSVYDGQLFLIQHLMILREQITPFDINFCITCKELDFSLMKDAFSSLLRGNFSWRRNSFGSPRVIENRIDTRKDLENAINEAIHTFCENVTSDFIEPLASFVTRVNI